METALKKLPSTSNINYLPKGFVNNIKDGSNVNTDSIASNIASPVNTPKQIVGINFDKIRIEKPNTIVIEVFKIADPTVE